MKTKIEFKSGHIFIWDEQGRLRRKLWFYPDGSITYREWDEDGTQLGELGEHPLLCRIKEEILKDEK